MTKDITSDIVKPDNQQMHFNLWTYKPQHDSKQDGWQDSAKDAEQKVTLEAFSYTPLKDDGSNHSNTPDPHGTKLLVKTTRAALPSKARRKLATA